MNDTSIMTTKGGHKPRIFGGFSCFLESVKERDRRGPVLGCDGSCFCAFRKGGRERDGDYYDFT